MQNVVIKFSNKMLEWNVEIDSISNKTNIEFVGDFQWNGTLKWFGMLEWSGMLEWNFEIE